MKIRTFIGLAIVTLAMACVPSFDSAEDGLASEASEIIMVGSMALSPQPNQSFFANNPIVIGDRDAYKDRINVSFVPINSTAKRSSLSPLVGAERSLPINSLYFVRENRTILVMPDAGYLTSENRSDFLRLSNRLRVNTNVDAQVVYVGHVVFELDEFLSVKNVRVVDQFDQVLPQIRARYGSDVKVVKSLWQQAN